jgi:hypothetical protein
MQTVLAVPSEGLLQDLLEAPLAILWVVPPMVLLAAEQEDLAEKRVQQAHYRVQLTQEYPSKASPNGNPGTGFYVDFRNSTDIVLLVCSEVASHRPCKPSYREDSYMSAVDTSRPFPRCVRRLF